MSIDPINDLLPDVLVVPITGKYGPLRVSIPESDETGLRTISFAKCESTGPLHKSRLKQRIGHLPTASWPALEAGLRRVLGLSAQGA